MKQQSYHDLKNERCNSNINALLQNLPPYVSDFFRAIQPRTTPNTRLAYLYDIRLFLRFLSQQKDIPLIKISFSDLEKVTELDIEKYIEYLSLYIDNNGNTRHNSENGKARKLFSLRSFYDYYYKRHKIKYNPTLLSVSPKKRPHNIIRLEDQEVIEFLDFLEYGSEDLQGVQKNYFLKNQSRNLALCTLLLGTGIRVSECVGMDLQDIDFSIQKIHIIRKGDREDFIFFGTEVADALKKYLLDRQKITPLSGHENAFFLSSQRRRMSVHAVENMISNYSAMLFDNKRITPHKLRSTFGTNLYRKTRDIFLVAEVLGHADVNTTKNYYTALDEERKKQASNLLQLRPKNS